MSFSRYFTSTLGNVFDAQDYGHKAWPIGGCKGKKKSTKRKA